MSSLAARLLAPVLVSILGCLAARSSPTLERAQSSDCPQFLSMRLVEAGGLRRFQPAKEWSANDDIDTLMVVVASEMAGSARTLVIEGGVRARPITDDIADTTLRYAPIANVAVRRLVQYSDSRRAWTVRPSDLDSMAGAEGEEQVLRVRASVYAGGTRACSVSLELLAAM
jgi:hypothetical protein